MVPNFEVLLSDSKFAWEPQSDGRVPEGAVSSGQERGEELYIGRAPFQGSMTIGKVSHFVITGTFISNNFLSTFHDQRFTLRTDVYISLIMEKKNGQLIMKFLFLRSLKVTFE